ncbi:MAG: type II toxin-antitoxin system VapC family toxin [Chloroflexi bacterium]|nr:type II toxin-antitoxin system VapC family toxin [Chloroflexota bacterium]
MTGANSAVTPQFVLDSYAVLAFLEGEPCAGRVKELLQQGEDGGCQLFISVINYGEVIYITERERGLSKTQEVIARMDELPFRIMDADRALAVRAAHIKARRAMAYADCFAAALAIILGAPLVTGDPEFKPLESAHLISIDWLDSGGRA